MLANPAAKFGRVPAPVVKSRPYESRQICIMRRDWARGNSRATVHKCGSGCQAMTHLTRTAVMAAVDRGEMEWVDKFHNAAVYAQSASATWQKTHSGPVATMQMVEGAPGRYVPVQHRETFEQAVEAYV